MCVSPAVDFPALGLKHRSGSTRASVAPSIAPHIRVASQTLQPAIFWWERHVSPRGRLCIFIVYLVTLLDDLDASYTYLSVPPLLPLLRQLVYSGLAHHVGHVRQATAAPATPSCVTALLNVIVISLSRSRRGVVP